MIIINTNIFETIKFKDAKKIKLMARNEYKCIVTDEKIIKEFIESLSENYYLMLKHNNYNRNYTNLYFDNENMDILKAHDNHDNMRQKIRIRKYEKDKVLEIKTKENGYSTKVRCKYNDKLETNQKWIEKNFIYNADKLIPVIKNSYDRITFISKDKSERITIDSNLSFFNYITNKSYHENNLFFIIEIKTENIENSKINNILQNLDIEITKFSKYYYGINKTNI
jgi:uncharacterized protein YegJ (DUF2314 family)